VKARQAGCRVAWSAPKAQLLALLPEAAYRWATDASDASACVRPDGAAADWLARPVWDVEKSAVQAPDVRAPDVLWLPLRQAFLPCLVAARPVSTVPCTPDAVPSAARSFAAAALAVTLVQPAQLAWLPWLAAAPEVW